MAINRDVMLLKLFMETVAWTTLFVLVGASPSLAQEPSPKWDSITEAVWLTFKDSPNMIDNCALKITYNIKFDTHTEWPAYCNDFRETSVVRARVKEARRIIVDPRFRTTG